MDDRLFMRLALDEARRAAALGEVPIGAVVVRDVVRDAEGQLAEGEGQVAGGVGPSGEVVGRGHNRREIDGDPLAHAEMLAIRQAAARVGDWRLTGCTLYVTLEPCAMCAGALVASRIDRLVYGAADPKAGFCGSLGNLVQDPRLNHRLAVVAGVEAEASSALLREFFASLRAG